LARVSFLGAAMASMLDGHFYHTFSLAWLMIILAVSFNPAPSEKFEQSYKNSTYAIIIILVFCVFFLQKHWNSYIQQQFPLTHESQLESVIEFPSYHRPIEWIYSQYSNPDLRSKALSFGQENGPRKCNYYLLEYLDAPESATSSAKQNILNLCTTYEIQKTQNTELIELLEDKNHNE